MEIGEEICQPAFSIIETKFEFRLFSHHVLVPFRLEHKIHVDRFYALDALEFHSDVLQNEIGSRAVWRSQRHVESQTGIVVEVDFVNKPQI